MSSLFSASHVQINTRPSYSPANSSTIVATYKVRNIPTLVFLKDGQEVARIVGATTKAEIVDKLSKLL